MAANAPVSIAAFLRCWPAALAVAVIGCASWKAPPPASLTSGEARPAGALESRNRVVLEVDFVNIVLDPADMDQTASLWQWVDETAIPVERRRRLLANGIRAGFVASKERFQQKLADASIDQDVVDSFLSEASVASDVSHGKKRIPMRMGRRYDLALKQPIEGQHVVLIRLGDETVGRTLNHAQYFYSITATPIELQEQVQLRFRPEIRFGEARQKWVSSDTALRIDNRRETWSIPELDLEVTAREGDTLVIAASSPPMGLAKQMLTGSGADQRPQQVVLLVRVAHIPTAVDQI